jgi:hypothetical protein
LIEIANASLTGNCNLLKVEGRFVGMTCIHGIKTVLPSPFPVKIVASITLPSIFFTYSLVPLQSFCGSRFRSLISFMVTPISIKILYNTSLDISVVTEPLLHRMTSFILPYLHTPSSNSLSCLHASAATICSPLLLLIVASRRELS